MGKVDRRGQLKGSVSGYSKPNETSFLIILIDLLCLRVAQMPRSPDLAIFVLVNSETDRTNCCIPYACMWNWGNNHQTQSILLCSYPLMKIPGEVLKRWIFLIIDWLVKT